MGSRSADLGARRRRHPRSVSGVSPSSASECDIHPILRERELISRSRVCLAGESAPAKSGDGRERRRVSVDARGPSGRLPPKTAHATIFLYEGPVGSATKRFYDASTGRLLAGSEKGDFFSTFLEAPDLESRCHSVSTHSFGREIISR